MREKRKAWVRFRGRRERKKEPNWKINKIIRCKATVILHICTVAVASLDIYKVLHVGKNGFASRTKGIVEATQVFTSFMWDNMEYLEF